MSLLQPVLAAALRPFAFSGRATRSEFWFYAVFSILLVYTTWQIDKFIFGHQATQLIVTDEDPNDGVHTVTRIPYEGTVQLGKTTLLVLLLIVLPLAAVARRRLRDAGSSSKPLVAVALVLVSPLLLVIISLLIWGKQEAPGVFFGYAYVLLPLISALYLIVLSVATIILVVCLLLPSDNNSK